MDKEIQEVAKWADALTQFAVTYGFQILGALVFLLIGLKIASVIGNRIARLAESRNVDPTLSRFFGSLSKLIIVAVLVIITLGNFGISIAPIIALAGASAFGVTLAVQGPLSNYGAGLVIILTRPFRVGSTITLHGVSGVVEEISLGATILTGEDGEEITIPNKEIVGQVIVNTHEYRIVETKICIEADEDAESAIAALKTTLANLDGIQKDSEPQAGVLDFTYGGLVLGIRCWVHSRNYFDVRFRVNEACLATLRKHGIRLKYAAHQSVALPGLETEPPMSPATIKSERK
jgi:small conductance mechanosensitive channel